MKIIRPAISASPVTKYYTYVCNSCGGPEYSESTGQTFFVIFEATCAEDADLRAEKSGAINFQSGSCCGQIWHRQADSYWTDSGTKTPEIDEQMVSDYYIPPTYVMRHFKKGQCAVMIHYINGTILGYGEKE